MTRPAQVLAALAGTVVMITIIRLLLPYGLSDTIDIVPEIYEAPKKDAPDQYLTDILAHNLWDQDRQPLTRPDDKVESDDTGSTELASMGLLSFKLIGVSRGEAEYFAVIESNEGIERYAPGDLLPDGSLLEEVLEYGVRISKSGENDRVYLFGKN